MRDLYLEEIEWVSGGDGTGDDGTSGGDGAAVGSAGNPQDAGEVNVSAYKPLITVVIPSQTVVSLNVDVSPSISTGVKVNVNVSSALNNLSSTVKSLVGGPVSSSTASGSIPAAKIVGNLP